MIETAFHIKKFERLARRKIRSIRRTTEPLHNGTSRHVRHDKCIRDEKEKSRSKSRRKASFEPSTRTLSTIKARKNRLFSSQYTRDEPPKTEARVSRKNNSCIDLQLSHPERNTDNHSLRRK